MRPPHQTLDYKFWQKLIQIGVPVSLQSMLFSLLGVVDIFMVSQLGEAATAAVGVGNRIFFFNLVMIFGISGAVSILASQYFGANNMDGVKVTLAQTWLAASLVTIPFIVGYALSPEAIISFISDDPAYIVMAKDYLVVTGISLVFTVLVVPLECALRAVGVAKLPTYVSILAIIINVVLNAILIFGLFGFPELGVLGAAIGSLLSRLAQTVLLFYLAHQRVKQLWPEKTHWLQTFTTSHRRRFLKVATPMFIHDTTWAFGLIIYNVIIGQLGVSELAIVSLLTPIEGVLISAFMGFAVAASIVLGNEIGAQNYQRVSDTAWWYVIISVVLALMLAVLFLLAKPLLFTLLEKSPIHDVQTAVNICLIMAFGMVLKVFNMVGIGGVLKSGGDINYSIFIDLFGQWGFGIPLAYITGIILGWPLEYVMLIILVEEVVKLILTTYRIRSKKWINNLVNDEEPLCA
ncbi:MATE family efflux transporter [Vibrio sp. TRT 17S01]|uniref:MATE family efflux transporter n=1 Tax=Vibrio sp. TRT 17S01 TaxID=3418505 RepID=UPI003CEE6086